MKHPQSPPADATIAQGLSALKRRGGTVLVVGAATTAHTDSCRQFLEGEDAEQVFVRTDRVVGDEDADGGAVIERAVRTRSAARTEPPDFAEEVDIRSLTTELRGAMVEAADVAGTVRVCFDSLRPLVDELPQSALVEFLQSIRESARATDAVVHLHLPAAVEAVPSELFDAADAVVELTGQGHTTYQQWHFPEADETSEWVKI